MLRTTRLFKILAQKVLRADNDKVDGGVGGDRADETVKNLSKCKKLKNNKSRNLTRVPITGAIEKFTFLTPNAKGTFNYISDQVTPNPKSNLAKFKILTKSNSNQWYPVIYFSRKMIPAKTWYETHKAKLLAIVEAFKTWHHYLEGCKYKVVILTNNNNLCQSMDTKSLSSR